MNPLTWDEVLEDTYESEGFKCACAYMKDRRACGAAVFPPDHQVFRALQETAFETVKVVILGQDPYHGQGQAEGLAFSVPDNIPIPPSLKNIFKEIKQDIGTEIPTSGNLLHWAHQGVLLLNTTLTVESAKPLSHANIGWESFTDEIIKQISHHKTGVIFLLWGVHAQKKTSLIDALKHHILTAPHPSPLSTHRGFFGCKHFSKTNTLLKEKGIIEINW